MYRILINVCVYVCVYVYVSVTEPFLYIIYSSLYARNKKKKKEREMPVIYW